MKPMTLLHHIGYLGPSDEQGLSRSDGTSSSVWTQKAAYGTNPSSATTDYTFRARKPRPSEGMIGQGTG